MPPFLVWRLIYPTILGFMFILIAMGWLTLFYQTPIAKAAKIIPQPYPTYLGASNALTYARVLTNEVPVYTAPLATLEGHTPIRTLGTGYLWVSLVNTKPISVNHQLWYHINKEEYVQAHYLKPFTPSLFTGRMITEGTQLPFAWMVYYVRPSITPGIAASNTPWLRRYDMVAISDVTRITETNWYQLNSGYWVHQFNMAVIEPIPRPKEIGATEKWVEVNLYEQSLRVYEGDTMVFATLVSSGLPEWQTVEGLFRLWAKVKAGKMSGGEVGYDYYFIEDVPWTMYFEGAYGLHGAYWHDGFGFPQSHGCVNMTLADARWLFDWMGPEAGNRNWTKPTAEDPGTWVFVHDGTGKLPSDDGDIAEVEELIYQPYDSVRN